MFDFDQKKHLDSVFGDHLFLAGKTAKIFDFGQQIIFSLKIIFTEISLKNRLNPIQE